MQDISIIPTACNENYAIKDQYYLDGVKKYRHFPSKFKKKKSVYSFYRFTGAKYKGWSRAENRNRKKEKQRNMKNKEQK